MGFSPAHTAHKPRGKQHEPPLCQTSLLCKPQTQAANQQGSSDPAKLICGKPTEDLLSAKCLWEVWRASELNKEHQLRATASLQSPQLLCRAWEQHISH